jgi:hypothetical protein
MLCAERQSLYANLVQDGSVLLRYAEPPTLASAGLGGCSALVLGALWRVTPDAPWRLCSMNLPCHGQVRVS